MTPTTAHVQPGMLFREFDVKTIEQGSILPSYPASRDLASVGGMVNNNSGAYFIVLAGALGFVLMYVAQIKAQVLNTYSGSLALSNLSDGLFRRHPGRVAMVVVGNLIGLAMVAGNILGLINSYLGILGVTTTALAAVIIADFFLVRRRTVVDPARVESVNWAGVVSVVVGSVVGGVLQQTGVFQLGFVVALVVVLALYPLLRRSVLAPRPVPAATARARETTA